MRRPVVLGIFHPTRHFAFADPEGAVECFGSLNTASRVFMRRAYGHHTGTYYVGRDSGEADWNEADETAYLDLWFADTCPEEPYLPDTFARRFTLGPRGGLKQEAF